MDTFSRSRLPRLLFESVSRYEFIHNYETLIELSRDEENSESSRLNFEWIRCAIRLDFFIDAVRELERFHSEQKKTDFSQLRYLEDLAELWLELDIPTKPAKLP